MSDYANYDAIVSALIRGQTDVTQQLQKVSDNAQSDCDINQLMQYSNATIIRNNAGAIIGYDYNYTTPNEVDPNALVINSNNDHGEYGEAEGGGGFTRGGGAGRGRHGCSAHQSGGAISMEAGARDENDNHVNTTVGYVSPSWGLTSVLAKLGKNANDLASNVIQEAGELTEDIYNTLLTMTEKGENAIRTLFGFDNNGNTTM